MVMMNNFVYNNILKYLSTTSTKSSSSSVNMCIFANDNVSSLLGTPSTPSRITKKRKKLGGGQWDHSSEWGGTEDGPPANNNILLLLPLLLPHFSSTELNPDKAKIGENFVWKEVRGERRQ